MKDVGLVNWTEVEAMAEVTPWYEDVKRAAIP
jgi:hypothetical protein